METIRWLDEREAAAWRGLQAMQAKLNARLAHELSAQSDLSYPDYAVLVALTDQPDGRMRAFELGHELGWEKSRVSHHISRMASRGLVTREPCPSDHRGAFVVVTAGGRTAIETAAPGHVAAVRRYVVDRLTGAQLDALAAITDVVLDALAATEPAPATGAPRPAGGGARATGTSRATGRGARATPAGPGPS